MAIDTRKYKQPHQRSSFEGLSREDLEYIEMMADEEVSKLMGRIKGSDPAFARSIAAKLFALNRPPKTYEDNE